jgi:hypothetical protein
MSYGQNRHSKKDYYIRRAHRYLGLFIAIQFILWTVSGLYFSWTNIDDIHGDLERKHKHYVMNVDSFVSPNRFMLPDSTKIDSLVSMSLSTFGSKHYYYIEYHQNGKHNDGLINTETGMLRPELSKEEAIAIAKENYNGALEVRNVIKVDSTDSHHEFRERPLPAWCIEAADNKNTHIYINAVNGKVDKFRNTGWRIFDFLWMTHVMDYKGRDNINNWLLRIFSVFGLITVLSGLTLFFVSGKRKK